MLQIYPMQPGKEDVAPRLWAMVYNLLFREWGQVCTMGIKRSKVRLGLYSEADAAAWATSSLPKLSGCGL